MAAKNLQYSPKRRLLFEKLSGKEGEAKCLKSVLDHHFNFSVGLLVPTISKPSLYENVPPSSIFNEFCCLAEMALTDLIDPDFIQSFVKHGSILSLSHGTRIDTSDCIALLPSGILHLSLTKDTYECLGIQGKPSPFDKKHRFDIEINLLAPYFKPTKKYYERVKRGFQKTKLKFKFLVSTISDSQATGEQLTNDLRSYFKSSGIHFQQFHTSNKVEEFVNIDIPVISYNNQPFTENAPETECNGLSFHEWLGCIACGIDCSDSAPDSFVNTLCCPTPHGRSQAAFCKWTGFLTSRSVQEVVKKARRMLTENPEIPWLSILVWGFSDCPVSWRNRRHGYYISGDNNFTLVLFPNDQVWMYQTLGDNDEQP